jgi:signal transduction histidine kinase
VDRPPPEAYQPRLTPWGHVWRTAAVLVISGAVWLTVAERQGERLFLLDVGLGALALGLSFFRRRWPVPVAVVTCAFTSVSALASGPATLASVSVATRRRWAEVVSVSAVGMAAAHVFPFVQPVEDEPLWLTFTVSLLATAAMMAWGLYVGSRRELMWTLRHRAERAEAEQELRVAQARSNERQRIAREMHDVLAHRISQISMHAGALSFREDLTAEEMRSSAGVIQTQAHEALTDLRGVLGVLRDGDRTAGAPQPTYADLAALVDEARQAGTGVTLVDRLAPEAPVPDAVGRTIYRIVQEGMTNARKHAPGTTLTIELSGSPEEGATVLMRNPLGFGPTATPGSGLGLVGLTERAELSGGRLEHGREGTTWVLRAWIPWAS